MRHISSCISGRILTALLFVLSTASVGWAHDESVPCTLDLVIYPAKVHVLLKFPIQSMLNGDASADPENAVRVIAPVDVSKIDREAYVKSKADQMAQGLHLTFDSAAMTPKVVKISTDELVLGVSGEDEMPRPVGVYEIEYTPEQSIPAPKLVTLDYNLLPTPNDGSTINVTCLVIHKQVDRKPPYPVYLTDGDRMTMRCDWSAVPTSVASSKPAPTPQLAAAPSSAPSTKPAKSPTDLGSLYIMIGSGVIVAACVLMILAIIFLRDRP